MERKCKKVIGKTQSAEQGEVRGGEEASGSKSNLLPPPTASAASAADAASAAVATAAGEAAKADTAKELSSFAPNHLI